MMMHEMARIFFDSIDHYMEMTHMCVEDIYETYYDDLMQTVINDLDLDYDDYEFLIFEAIIKKHMVFA